MVFCEFTSAPEYNSLRTECKLPREAASLSNSSMFGHHVGDSDRAMTQGFALRYVATGSAYKMIWTATQRNVFHFAVQIILYALPVAT